jgi:hypothetical protein
MRHRLVAAITIAVTSSLASAGSKPAPNAAPVASATPTTASLIDDKLVKPLVAKEREQSKFSRARPAPSERRVRVLDEQPAHDSAGNAFFAFAIDTRRGWHQNDDDSNWTKSAMTGCVYLDRGEVFIKRGNAFHPAAAAVGKKTKAAPAGTCTATAQLSQR